MQHKFKYITIVLAILLVGGVPHGAHADKGSGKQSVTQSVAAVGTGATTSQSASSYCAEIDSLASKILTTISDQEKNYKKMSGDRAKELTEKRSSIDSAESARRTSWDENRSEHFKLLEAKAKTDAERKAISAFKVSIEKAIMSRKTAVDAANVAFRSAVDKALNDRMTSFNAATTTFKMSVDKATQKAKSECASKQTSNTTRDAFRNALKDARLVLENNAKGVTQINVDAAMKIRNAALEKAQKDFAGAVDKALKDLKASAPTL